MLVCLVFGCPILMSLLFCFYISYCCSLMLRLFFTFFVFCFFFFTKSRRPFRCLLLRRGFHLDSLPLNSGWWRAVVMVDLLEPSPICTQDLWRSAKVITGYLTWNFSPQIVQFVLTASSGKSLGCFRITKKLSHLCAHKCL